ncbi:MAG: alpha-ribazole kinase [Zhaonellaceae bacterium]
MSNSPDMVKEILSPWPLIKQVRDLSIISLQGGQSLVIACDSGGAIGEKELDEVKVPNYILGRFITRVALLEVLAAGAIPVLVCDTLTVEMKPSGEEIIRGIKDELGQLAFADKIHLNGTTEENMKTRQSGIGITIVGLAQEGSLRLAKAQAGDDILCFGYPKLGSEVKLDDPEIIDVSTVLSLLAYQEVRELVPVGSKGILYEAQALAETSGLKFVPEFTTTLPLEKSAGPATCLVAAVKPQLRAELEKNFSQPVTKVGSLQG